MKIVPLLVVLVLSQFWFPLQEHIKNLAGGNMLSGTDEIFSHIFRNFSLDFQ